MRVPFFFLMMVFGVVSLACSDAAPRATTQQLDAKLALVLDHLAQPTEKTTVEDMRKDSAQIRALVGQGASVKTRGPKSGATVLWAAASSGDVAFVKEVLRRGAKPSRTDPTELASAGNAEIVRLLLKAGADVGARNRSRHTVLHRPSAAGQLDVVTALVAGGAEVDAQYRLGQTPLMWATMNGRGDVVRFLLAKGADPHLKNRSGETALNVAETYKRAEIAKLLRGAQAKE